MKSRQRAIIVICIVLFGVAFSLWKLEVRSNVQSELASDEMVATDRSAQKALNETSDQEAESTPLVAANAPPVAFLTNSLYPFLPYDVYAANIELAVDGDVDAQYLVYKVFSECEAAPRDIDSLRRIQEIAADDPEFLAEQEFRYERCRQIQGSSDEMKNAKRHWYTQAYQNGHPIVVAWQEIMYNDDRSVARESLMNALNTGQYEAYDYAAIFLGMKLSNQPGEQAEEYSDPWLYSVCRSTPGCDTISYDLQAILASSPWMYLGCKNNPGCDVDHFEINNLSAVFDSATVDEIKRRATELEEQLANGQFDNLGL